MAEQEQNRNEPASPFKLEEAKKQGQVAKSLDFNSFVIVWAMLLAILISGETVFSKLASLSVSLFQGSAVLRIDRSGEAFWFGDLLREFMSMVLPFAVVGIAFALLANVLQTGPIFTFVPLKPKFERINPIAGFKRVFNKRMLFEAVKTFLKLVFFAAILYEFLMALWPGLPAVATNDVGMQLSWLAVQGKSLMFRLGLAMLAIGIVDLAYVRWQFRKQMMMSRREMKEEVKRREGDPQIRAKIRELQRETLKQASALGRVPEADVLITNPQHLAIALKYVRGEMNAPVVIAKGSEAWAADMRKLAARHQIRVIEHKKLARLLFRHARIDQPIPPESFVDVARIYAQLGADRHSGRLEVIQ
jgi:flagellar biosynthetic protein FlhB